MSFRLLARPATTAFRSALRTASTKTTTSSPLFALRPQFPQQTTSLLNKPRAFTTTTPKMTVHIFETAGQFKEAVAAHPVVVVDAFATWCGPCKAIAPQIAKWAEDPEFKDKIYFCKFDVDHLPELAQELGIRAMPTFIFYKDGERVDELMGANPPALLNLLRKYLGGAGSGAGGASSGEHPEPPSL
ncbi:thioredoxin-like protein [Cercophora samala]|uniref:Thioredoxin-like protein n=1 Tax=Cercophora samala TaxID=330535 RepID=A0AA40DDJ5_9PEZI|nr:thioredoxin-like protein [Cercophora samala]